MPFSKLLAVVSALAAFPALAGDLTDIWIDPLNPGVRAVLVQHDDLLSLDLHQEMSLSGTAHLHAPALDAVGLDVAGRRVFAGADADGLVGVTVSSIDSATVTLELGGPGIRQRLTLSRMPVEAADLGGRFVGGYGHSGAPCPAFSGVRRERSGVWNLFHADEHDPGRLMLRFAADDGSQICRFDGRQTDMGRISRISGEYRCDFGGAGTFELDPIQRSDLAFSGVMRIETRQCGPLRLKMGGVRLP